MERKDKTNVVGSMASSNMGMNAPPLPGVVLPKNEEETTMKSARYLSVVALVIAAVSGSASAQVVSPTGKAYVFHSPAGWRCPGLDWLLVVDQNGVINGMVAWDNMAHMAKATGTINSSGQVQLTAVEGGDAQAGRSATVTGTVDDKGWLVSRRGNFLAV